MVNAIALVVGGIIIAKVAPKVLKYAFIILTCL